MKRILYLCLIIFSLCYAEGESNWIIYNTDNSRIPNNRITTLCSNDSLLWVGGTEGFASFNGEEWKVYNEDNSPVQSNIIEALCEDDSLLWIGTYKGLSSFDGQNWKLYDESIFSTDDITCLAVQDSLLWVGTWGKGVFSFNGVNWENHSFVSGSTFNFVQSITANDSLVWIGTPDAGVASYNGNAWELAYLNNWTSAKMDRFVNCLYQDGDSLWVGTSLGLYRNDGEEWYKYYQGSTMSPECPLSVYINDIAKDGDWMWFATAYGLVWYDGHNWAKYNTDNSIIPSNSISSLALYNDYVWVGTSDGLIRYNKMNVSIDDSPSRIPLQFQLAQNYPNPFNPTTTISYQLSAVSDVELEIYDLSGRKLNQWFYQDQTAGIYELTWNGKDQNGNPVPSGVYIYRMVEGEYMQSKKMVLMK